MTGSTTKSPATKFVVGLTLVGGPTAKIDIDDVHFLTDPSFDPPKVLTIPGVESLEKLEGPAIPSNEIGPLDAILLSHDEHPDNLDESGRDILPKAAITYTTPGGAKRLGGNTRGLEPFETVEFNPRPGKRLFITGVPARHGPPGSEPIVGIVTGFVIGVDKPGDAVYVTGDTVWYEGIAEIARRYSPKLIVVFAGGAKPLPFRVTMDVNDVLETANAFPNATIAAVHVRGWKHFKEPQATLDAAFEALGIGSRLVSLEPGKLLKLEFSVDAGGDRKG